MLSMKPFTLLALLAALILGAVPNPVAAAPLLSSDKPICLPQPVASVNEDCQDLGPNTYFGRMAQVGLDLPMRGLPATNPNEDLAYLPYAYARVTGQPGRVFANVEDAAAGNPIKRTIDPGFDYVSYVEVREINGWKYYMIDIGEWMRSDDLSAGVATSRFMGLEFFSTPTRPFGWVLQPLQTQVEAGIGAPAADKTYTRFDIVQVYATREEDGLQWYLVGPDTWIEARYASLVYPAAAPPDGVDNGRWIEVNLAEQTLSVYEDGRLRYAALISTGVPGFWTRPGLFQIYEKLETTPMSGAFEADRSDYYYLEDVPWTMYFDEARALHGAYWHTKFGYEQSHGCVNIAPGDSYWLFQWAELGDWVYVWDASGETPTDPALYGSGGA